MAPSTSSPVGLAQQSSEGVTFDLHSVETLSEIRISGIPALPLASRPSTDAPSADLRRSALKTKPANVATYELPPKIGPPIHSKRIEPKRVERGIKRDRRPPVPAAIVAPPLLQSRGPSPAPSIADSPRSTPAPPLLSPHLSPEPRASTPGATTPISMPLSPLAQALQPPAPNSNNSTAVQCPQESRKRRREDSEGGADDDGADGDGAKSDDTNDGGATSGGANDDGANDDGANNDGANNDGANSNRGQRRSKRIRTSSSMVHAPDTTEVLNPTSAASQVASDGDDDDDDASPEWFQKAVLMLSSKDLGGGWLDLVSIWGRFEKAAGYMEAGILGSEDRPPCVGAWIARARSPRYQPALSRSNLEDLDRSFWRWWTALQPEHRMDNDVANDGHVLPQTPGDMEAIRRPGKNGLLSVLAALWFWGSTPEVEYSTTLGSWASAVDDVSWVIEELLK